MLQLDVRQLQSHLKVFKGFCEEKNIYLLNNIPPEINNNNKCLVSI